jgi:hypothetical protein
VNLSRNLFVALALTIAPGFVSALQADPLHVTTKSEQTQASVSPEGMDQRILESASAYKRYAPVPRFAFFDLALPINAAEHIALDRNLVLYLAVLSQERAELPLKRVYVLVDGAEVELKPISSVISHQPPGPVVDTFGRFRQDALYLLPLVSRMEAKELLADFQGDRLAFKLGTFSDNLELPADVSKLAGEEPIGTGPTPAGLNQILRREYPGFVSLTANSIASQTPLPSVSHTKSVPNTTANKNPWSSPKIRVGLTFQQFMSAMSEQKKDNKLSEISRDASGVSLFLQTDSIGSCNCSTQFNFEGASRQNAILSGIEYQLSSNADLQKVVAYLGLTYGKPTKYMNNDKGTPIWEHPLGGGYGAMCVAEKATSESKPRVSFIRGKD